MRTFVAVDVPDEHARAVGTVQERLRRCGADVRWVDPSSLHFTLKFLGELKADELGPVDEELRRVADAARPAMARLRGVGCFPSPRRPRVVWVGVEPADDRLSRLQSDIESRLAELGFSPDKRDFHPHVTLGRVKGGRGRNRLVEVLEAEADADIGEITVEEFVLFESRLSPQGARYEPVSTYSLGAPESGEADDSRD